MLAQFHHKHRTTGKSQFIAQRDFHDGLTQQQFSRELKNWCEHVQKRHPLPPDHEWWMMDETSPHFMLVLQPQGME